MHEEDPDREHPVERASTTDGLPVAPSLESSLEAAGVERHAAVIERRTIWICALSAAVGAVAAGVARLLTELIALVTNVAFHGRFATANASPWNHSLGAAVILVPIAGALIVGAMARFGSDKIRGHGIPEA